MKYFTQGLLGLVFVLAPLQSAAQSKPDILILGDSQISFGAGEIYLDFFKNLQRNCAGTDLSASAINKLGQRRTVALGVRSTSLHSWVARSGAAKGSICNVDKKYGVNAGVYGAGGNTKRKFIQVGKERGFRYCQKGRSAFEVVFEDPKAAPELVILNFLGNAEKRWSQSQSDTDTDVRRTLEQIPTGVPCVVLTTAPVLKKSTNDRRMKAQANLVKALGKAGGRCHVAEGFTLETRKAIEGKSQYFRRNKQGRVTDPHHPNKSAIREFIKITGPKLCNAVASALK